jgi:hypothetical protein
MAAPTFQLSESNGSGATVTDNIPQIAYASVDSASSSSLSSSNPITAGNNSYEKYNRVKCTGAAPNSIGSFGFYYSSTAPQDSAGSSSTVSLYYDAASNPSFATPVATTSSVATSNTTGNTSSPGQSLNAPANSSGSYSGYMVTQFRSTSGAAGGNCTFASPELTIGYVWS